jgi:lantibiotic modifying enzyme
MESETRMWASPTPWVPLSSDHRIERIVRDLAQRLQNTQCLQTALNETARQADVEHHVPWRDTSLTGGYAGLALLAAYLDTCYPAEGWDQAGHRHLSLAVAQMVSLPSTDIGLSSGIAGVAFTAWSLSRSGTRYRTLLAQCDQQIGERIHDVLAGLDAQQHGYAASQYDVISGLSGVAAYLLCRAGEDAELDSSLRAIAGQLIALSASQDGCPRWFIPRRLVSHPDWLVSFPDGMLDAGLAHGIAGPLALLALLALHGVDLDGITLALDRMATWIIEHRTDDAWGPNWASAYPLPGRATTLHPAHSAWCYGAPGICRALWLAGEALDRDQYRSAAIEAMKAVCHRPQHVRGLKSPGLCHGTAGLLQIMLRFAHDTGESIFCDTAWELTEHLISRYESTTLLGYRDDELGYRLDRPDLLNGTAGITLTLMAVAQPHEPTWDRCLLLS